MSDEKKTQLKLSKVEARAAALGLTDVLFRSPVPNAAGLPAGVRVVTNANAVARFPLPLTLGSSVVLALGAFAMARKHRAIGVMLLALGGIGIGAAGAAPEINKALKGGGG